MAGRIVKDVSQTITGVSAATGSCTVASSVGYYKGAYAYLRANSQPGLTVEIIDVPDATHVCVRAARDPRGGGIGNVAGDPIRADIDYGATDPTAYNGGVITQPAQLVYNPNDLGLT